MIAYIDGAENEKVTACGMVLLLDDEQIEKSFKLEREASQPRGLHEFYALAKLCQTVVEMGLPFESVSVYSDCQRVTQAQFVLHPPNCVRSLRRNDVVECVRQVCEMVGDKDLPLAEFIEKARIHWVKGHRNTVYNQRADYLAYGAMTGKKKSLSYEKWVKEGFCLFVDGQPTSWYPPFSGEKLNKDDSMDVVKMKFGSVLYGTNTPASDTDYKGIYLPPLREILLKGPLSHKSESTKDDERQKNTAADVDTEFYSLAYFVKMAIEGETVCIDMLHANKESILTPDNWIWASLVENRHRFFSKNMKAFIGYVLRQTAKYGIKGSRLQAMEDVIEHMEWNDGENWYPTLKDVWDKLPVNEYCTKEKRPGANDRIDNFYVVCGKMYLDNMSCKNVYTSIQKMYEGYGARAQQAKENQGIDWKAVSHAMRACYQLRDIYLHGGFTYPLRDAAELKAVKAGELDYLGVVAPKLETLVSEINELAAKSNYPDKVDKEFWDRWLLTVYSEAFDINCV